MKVALLFFCGLFAIQCATAADPTDPLARPRDVPPSEALPPRLPAHPVTWRAVNQDSREAVKTLLKQSGLKYDVPMTLPARKLSLQFNGVPWAEVFRSVVASAHYDYRFDEKGVLHVFENPVKKAKR